MESLKVSLKILNSGIILKVQLIVFMISIYDCQPCEEIATRETSI